MVWKKEQGCILIPVNPRSTKIWRRLQICSLCSAVTAEPCHQAYIYLGLQWGGGGGGGTSPNSRIQNWEAYKIITFIQGKIT